MSGGRRLAGLPPLARPPACASALLRGPPSLGRAAASSLPSAPARPRAGRSPWGSRAVLASSWGGLGVGGAGASGFRGVGLGPFRPPAPPIAAAGVRWRKESERQGPTVGGRGGVGSRASRPVPGRVASRWLGGVKRARRSPPPTGLRRSISPPRLLVSPPPALVSPRVPGGPGMGGVGPPARPLPPGASSRRPRPRGGRARAVAALPPRASRGRSRGSLLRLSPPGGCPLRPRPAGRRGVRRPMRALSVGGVWSVGGRGSFGCPRRRGAPLWRVCPGPGPAASLETDGGLPARVPGSTVLSLPPLLPSLSPSACVCSFGRASRARPPSGAATSDQTWRPAEFKHISQRRKRN